MCASRFVGGFALSHQSVVSDPVASLSAWRRLAVVLLIAAFALAGCGRTIAADGTGGQAPAGRGLSDRNLKSVLTSSMDKTTVHMTMTADATQGGQSMHMEASGTADASGSQPLMAMDMKVSADGESHDMSMRLLPGALYVQIPELDTKWAKLDLTSDDPTAVAFRKQLEMSDPKKQTSAMLDSVKSVVFKGTETHEGEQWDKYEVVVDPRAAVRAMDPTADTSAVPDSVTEYVWVDQKDRPRKMQFDMSGVSMTMEFSKFGEPVDIVAPPADEVSDQTIDELFQDAA